MAAAWVRVSGSERVACLELLARHVLRGGRWPTTDDRGWRTGDTQQAWMDAVLVQGGRGLQCLSGALRLHVRLQAAGTMGEASKQAASSKQTHTHAPLARFTVGQMSRVRRWSSSRRESPCGLARRQAPLPQTRPCQVRHSRVVMRAKPSHWS